jgi:general secretion pathway protein D
LVNTQFQYIDVGVNIEMTPTIHFDHDVTLKVKLEVSSESGSVTISDVTEPIIAQKTSEQVIRLREGEVSILSGILDKEDTVAWNGLPGLSAIPGLKYLFGSKDHTIKDDEIVFLLIPHIVRTQELSPVNLRTIDTGVGQSIELRHVSADAPVSKPTPAPARSTVGVVPGQTAQAAAPAALAQLRDAADAGGAAAAAQANQQSRPLLSGPVSFSLNAPEGPVAVGATFQVPVVLMGGTDVASVPLQLQYDPAKLSLVNVDSGDLLTHDGQAVALVHRDDGPGSITINASRPPGAAGVSGAGVVCVLSFQAKAAGESVLAITRPAAVNSAQQQLQAKGAQVSILVR